MNVKRRRILDNGITMPSIGFGTWKIKDGSEAYDSVLHALNAGYRHIDTAAAYNNEASVGKAIRDSGIRREEIFLTTKLRAELKGYDVAKKELEASLERLATDYVDLYLIHAPKPWNTSLDVNEYVEANIETWKAFISMYEEGRCKAIGVSNFIPEQIQRLFEKTGFIPHVDQIYICPGRVPEDTEPYARENGICLEAYSPFASGRLFRSNELKELAERYQVTPAQLALRWSLQRGYIPLPKSTNPERIKENYKVFDFEIDRETMKILDNMKIPAKE